jgi:LAO/AO transport system ATPase
MSVALLIEQWRRRDRLALARLLTLASRGEHLDEIRSGVAASSNLRPHNVIAVTGSGGVGKSTLIGELIETLRGQNKSVAVLACDPESPLTGGALLGDRLRMPARPEDAGLFIRSIATPSGRQALAEHLDLMTGLLAGFGFDVIMLETVGAGQGDTAVRQFADLVVVLLQPEAGDDVQWEKAGLLEVADIVVVHKADLPGTDRTEAQVRSLLNLPGCREIPIVRVSSTKKTGFDQLTRLLAELPSRRIADRQNGRALLSLAQDLLAQRFRQRQDDVRTIQKDWESHHVDDQDAAAALLERLAKPSG